jgi:hypothetical protein
LQVDRFVADPRAEGFVPDRWLAKHPGMVAEHWRDAERLRGGPAML